MENVSVVFRSSSDDADEDQCFAGCDWQVKMVYCDFIAIAFVIKIKWNEVLQIVALVAGTSVLLCQAECHEKFEEQSCSKTSNWKLNNLLFFLYLDNGDWINDQSPHYSYHVLK